MLHTNRGEFALLVDTFCRVWGAGGQATLTTTTKDGQVQAKLELQLGHPADARPGAPGVQHRLSAGKSSAPPPGHPGAARRPRHRGPAARAKNRARAALHQAAKAGADLAEAASALPAPSSAPPAVPAGPPSPTPAALVEAASASPAEGALLSSPPTGPDGASLPPTAALAEADSASPARPCSPTEPAGVPLPPQPEVTNLGEAVPASPAPPSTPPTEPAGPLHAPSPEKLDYITFCDRRTGKQVFKCKKRGKGDHPPPMCCYEYSDLHTLKMHDWSDHNGPPPIP